jgi:TPR repeat protein
VKTTTKVNSEKIALAKDYLFKAKRIIECLENEVESDSYFSRIQQALFLLESALSYGLGDAGYTLACLYSTGKIVSKSDSKASVYIKASAQASDVSVKGLRLQGIREYRSGNISEAKALLTRSAYLGNSDASLDLASISTKSSERAGGLFRALELISVSPVIDAVNDSEVYAKILSKRPSSTREDLH